MDETTLYYIAMVVIYSGLGSWLVSRLTRSKADLRELRRTSIRSVLDLMAHIKSVREHVSDPGRQAELDAMWTRLMNEASDKVRELNNLAEHERDDPAQDYLILPPPRSPFAAFISLVFAASLYVGVGALLFVASAFVIDQSLDLTDPAHVEWALLVSGLGVGLCLVAFIARLIAFRIYAAIVRKERLPAAPSA